MLSVSVLVEGGGGQNDLEKCVISGHLRCYDVNNPYVIVVARYFRFL